MDIIFKGRHTDVQERFREHAAAKLAKIEKLDPKVIRIDVELSTERNPRLAGRKERVELTITTRGPAIRAEAAAEDRAGALDLAYAKLESRLRRASDRRKCRHAGAVRLTDLPEAADPAPLAAAARPAGARAKKSPPPGAADTAGGDAADSLVPIEMDGDGPLVVRQKFHAAVPMSIDQALFEMELVGHDFFLFRDVQAGQPSVVYRRRGYQYGVLRLVEEVAGADADGEQEAARPRPNGLANGQLRRAERIAGTAPPA